MPTHQLQAVDHGRQSPPEPPAQNYVAATFGRVRAVCQCCGRQSRPVNPDADGEPSLWAMARGWSTAPFPANCQHDDGSKGSFFTCPSCNSRLHKGEQLQVRAYIQGASTTVARRLQ